MMARKQIQEALSAYARNAIAMHELTRNQAAIEEVMLALGPKAEPKQLTLSSKPALVVSNKRRGAGVGNVPNVSELIRETLRRGETIKTNEFWKEYGITYGSVSACLRHLEKKGYVVKHGKSTYEPTAKIMEEQKQAVNE